MRVVFSANTNSANYHPANFNRCAAILRKYGNSAPEHDAMEGNRRLDKRAGIWSAPAPSPRRRPSIIPKARSTCSRSGRALTRTTPTARPPVRSSRSWTGSTRSRPCASRASPRYRRMTVRQSTSYFGANRDDVGSYRPHLLAHRGSRSRPPVSPRSVSQVSNLQASPEHGVRRRWLACAQSGDAFRGMRVIRGLVG
jgi:hypothetical protein